MRLSLRLIIFFLVLSFSAIAQKNQLSQDTLLTDSLPKHSPLKASIMSAVLPGLGQVYNKKYWKIPVIYAAMATTVYLSIDLNRHKIKAKLISSDLIWILANTYVINLIQFFY